MPISECCMPGRRRLAKGHIRWLCCEERIAPIARGESEGLASSKTCLPNIDLVVMLALESPGLPVSSPMVRSIDLHVYPGEDPIGCVSCGQFSSP